MNNETCDKTWNTKEWNFSSWEQSQDSQEGNSKMNKEEAWS